MISDQGRLHRRNGDLWAFLNDGFAFSSSPFFSGCTINDKLQKSLRQTEREQERKREDEGKREKKIHKNSTVSAISPPRIYLQYFGHYLNMFYLKSQMEQVIYQNVFVLQQGYEYKICAYL